MHGGGTAPTASNRTVLQAFQWPGALRTSRLTVALGATQRLSDAILRNGQQHRTAFQCLGQHAYGRVRHTGADGRIRDTRQLVTVEPANPRTRLLRHRRKRMNRRTEAADRRLPHMCGIGFPLALHASGIRHRHEYSAMGLGTQTQYPSGIGVRHHAVGILIAHIIHDQKQGTAFHRRIHGGPRSDDA